MSETAVTRQPESESVHHAGPEPAEPAVNPSEVFDNAQLHYFDSEDGHAGSVLGKMLSLFFLYTVVVMALVAVWTFAVAD